MFDNNGTLDKYIGDGLMATFGTPDPGPQDSANALQCAMDMIASLEDWNAERIGEGKAPVRVGIGLHYGAVIAGDIGNERRLEYSVIGDAVNIASRLEYLTRKLNSNVVVSDSLVQAIDQNTNQSKKLISRLTKAGCPFYFFNRTIKQRAFRIDDEDHQPCETARLSPALPEQVECRAHLSLSTDPREEQSFQGHAT